MKIDFNPKNIITALAKPESTTSFPAGEKTLLELAQEDGVTLTRASSTDGGTYHGACPVCGGTDRFRIQAAGGSRLKDYCECNQCSLKGDAADYLQTVRGLSKSESYKLAGIDLDSRTTEPHRATKPEQPVDTSLWSQSAENFISWPSRDIEKSEEGKRILAEKRISLDTARQFGIRYNPKDEYFDCSDWGIPTVEGEKNKLVIPTGLLIPIFNSDGQVIRLICRREIPYNGNRYHEVKGGQRHQPLVAGSPASDHIFMIESFLDVVLLHQEAGDFAQFVAGGGTSFTPEKQMLESFRSRQIHLALDNDEAGVNATKKLKALIPAARILPILHGKDPSDAAAKGLSLRAWVLAGVSGDYSRIEGLKEEMQRVEELMKQEQAAGVIGSVNISDKKEDKITAKLNKASRFFPRIPFPWGVFPDELSKSLNQLADSLGVLPDHIPDTAMAVLASIMGRQVVVQAKQRHVEPLIFFFMDVRPAGTGKTPAQAQLTERLKEIQEKSDAVYEEELNAWLKASEDERKGMEEPVPPRSYYATNYTSEGLRTALKKHPTGGMVLVLDEGSALISSQNAYRSGGKGSDREALCELYNGNTNRGLRAKEVHSVPRCAVSITAGIQPEICKRTFGGEDGLYLVDGTIMRFCFTYSGKVALDIDSEVYWTDENKAVWDNIVNKALAFQIEPWADGKPNAVTLTFTKEARQYFYNEWRNNINRIGKHEIEIDLIDGFIQKAVTNAIRFTGLIVLVKCFHAGAGIPFEIGIDDVKKGIRLAEFYLGQTVDIIRMFLGSDEDSIPPVIVSEELNRLAAVLDSMRGKTEKGMLSIGFITDEYNRLFPAGELLTSNKAGNLVNMAGLKKAASLKDINGRKRVSCMVWDEKTDSFIKRVSRISQSLLVEENQVVTERETPRERETCLSLFAKKERDARDIERHARDMQNLQLTDITTSRETERCERPVCKKNKFETVFDEDDFIELTQEVKG